MRSLEPEGNAVSVTDRIEEIIEPSVNDLGFDLVRVHLSGGHNPRLQVMAEPLAEREMTVEDCASISRAVSALLDVEDPITEAYTLEVSSPGLDRPLVRLPHFERFAGFEARIEMSIAIDGQKRFRGRLGGVDGDNVLMNVDGEEMALPFSDIYRAKLIMTDELLAQAEGRN
jgi:ribosome maturation factor RimP